MKGIIVADLESLIKNADVKLNDVRDEIQNVRSSALDLRRSIRGGDLMFLTDSLYDEIVKLNNVMKKMNAYQLFLRSVLIGYQRQEQQIISSIKKATP